jgi:type IV pilus assembly protein PilO
MQYTQGPPGPDLTEISLDAGITGDYPQIMRFVNALERDKTFFVIRQMALTGQQGGLVNLRLRVSTWLRPADAAASGLPSSSTTKAEPSAAGPEGQ